MKDIRVAYVTGNYNSVVDGVAMIANKQVAALLNAGVPVRVYAPVALAAQIENHAGELVPVPSIPFVPPYRLALGLTPFIRQDLVRFNPTLVYVATPNEMNGMVSSFHRTIDTRGFANCVENLIRKPDRRKGFSAAGVQRASEYR